MIRELYQKLELPPETEPPMPCPCCEATPEIWEYSEDGVVATKAVMCSYSEPIGPQQGVTNEGCPLYMPAECFYQATIREAIKFWNNFAMGLRQVRASNYMARKRVANMRGVTGTETRDGLENPL